MKIMKDKVRLMLESLMDSHFLSSLVYHTLSHHGLTPLVFGPNDRWVNAAEPNIVCPSKLVVTLMESPVGSSHAIYTKSI